MQGWIGVDLDGTLAEYHGWQGPGFIGKPVPRMVDRVKLWLSEGKEVRVFTARVFAPPDDPQRQLEAAFSLIAIRGWCVEHLGVALPVTCQKDFGMVELWDDRATQVVTNTGEAVGCES